VPAEGDRDAIKAEERHGVGIIGCLGAASPIRQRHAGRDSPERRRWWRRTSHCPRASTRTARTGTTVERAATRISRPGFALRRPLVGLATSGVVRRRRASRRPLAGA
jgi:hypothetical protein